MKRAATIFFLSSSSSSSSNDKKEEKRQKKEPSRTFSYKRQDIPRPPDRFLPRPNPNSESSYESGKILKQKEGDKKENSI
ncbi:hypothetical protein LI328DRAFT_44523 [Trichoderma asperelloides]|nr:hypothetical protein LI328DRAFT_44523 [Trichoderma asperelloides]